MKKNLHYAAVIFDMDGLMFDSEKVGFDGFCLAAKKYGYHDVDKFFTELIGKNIKDADLAIRQTFGFKFPIDEVRRYRDDYIRHIRSTTGIPVKKGLYELLLTLKKKNIPIAIASSSSREVVEENLAKASLRQYFNVIICGDEIHFGKPHPEIYMKTAESLHVPPEQCLVLEDSLLGIEAANAAGMICIMVPDMQAPTEDIKNIVHSIFPSLLEVQQYLEGIDHKI